MEIALIVLAFVLLAAGLLGVIVPALPGPPLSYAGLLILQWSRFAESGVRSFSLAFLLLWAGITAAVTILDYILPPLLTRKFGGSRAAEIGSFAGLLAGMFLFPPVGLIAGPFLGALAGELIHSSGNGPRAFKAALGAFVAFIAGSGAKLIVCALMIYYAVKVMF